MSPGSYPVHRIEEEDLLPMTKIIRKDKNITR
jgi:hypothetical protein